MLSVKNTNIVFTWINPGFTTENNPICLWYIIIYLYWEWVRARKKKSLFSCFWTRKEIHGGYFGEGWQISASCHPRNCRRCVKYPLFGCFRNYLHPMPSNFRLKGYGLCKMEKHRFDINECVYIMPDIYENNITYGYPIVRKLYK